MRHLSIALCAVIATLGCKNLIEEDGPPIGPTALTPAGAESACGSANPRASFSGDECYDPQIEEADFAGVAEDHPLFPLVPGTTWRYESESKEGAEINTVEVTNNVKTINLPGGGTIMATVVLDEVYECDDLDDCDLVFENLIERTFDWYAQSVDGDVWYFGEESYELENGQVVSMEGSWEAFVDGALPGIIMLAEPHIGQTYRQEYYAGEAEDLARVVSLDRSVSVPYGDFDGCMKTQDWNPLEPPSQESKYYCPLIGLALEVAKNNVQVELVDMQ